MSQSPRTGTEGLSKYRDGWKNTMQMLRDGKSFSGRETNCVFLNCRDAPFANLSGPSGLDFADDGRAVCLTDWDHDGDLDVWLHNRTGPRLRFMRNRGLANSRSERVHFIAIRLRGTTSNRDGIGSRVTVWLRGDERPISRTLHAGDGFLSQSSKWLHFGLGANEIIDRVEIQWPNGNRESFADIVADRRYLLTEGNTSPQQIPTPPRSITLEKSDQPTETSDSNIRTALSNRIPIPLMSYKTLGGEERTVESNGQPQLIVLWASWCPTCRTELQDLTARFSEINQAGVKPLLISLDGLDVQNPTGIEDINRFIEQFNVPYDVGIAERSLLEKLELTESVLFNRAPPLAVPLSLLLDEKGGIAAIYRGAIDVDRVLVDTKSLTSTQSDRRNEAVPFAGRWLNPPKQMLLRAVGHLFKENGFDDDHSRYLALEAEQLARQRRKASSQEQRKQLDEAYAASNYNLGVTLVAQGQDARAFEFFQQAVNTDPNHADALVNLAVIYAKSRDIKKSVELLQRAISINPDSVAARANLANAMSAGGVYSRAIPHYRHLVDMKKANASIHSRLARALIETGKIAEAVEHLDAAVEMGAADVATLSSLAWIRATADDESIRDGRLAIASVERLVGIDGIPAVMLHDIHSAAKAETGDFKSALALADKAVEALGERQPKLRAIIEARISGYQNQQPHRDPNGKYP